MNGGKSVLLSFRAKNLENVLQIANIGTITATTATKHCLDGMMCCVHIASREDEKRKVKLAIISFSFCFLVAVFSVDAVNFCFVFFFVFVCVAQLKVPPVIIRLFVLFSQ